MKVRLVSLTASPSTSVYLCLHLCGAWSRFPRLRVSILRRVCNSGIWTKHLKAKTELHQTVIDRCLKSLVQKQLIKATKSVKVHILSSYRFMSQQVLPADPQFPAQ